MNFKEEFARARARIDACPLVYRPSSTIKSGKCSCRCHTSTKMKHMVACCCPHGYNYNCPVEECWRH